MPISTATSPPSGKTGPRSRRLTVLVIVAALAAAALLALVSLQDICATDFWWQYKTGAYVSANGPPTVDVFSFVSRDRPWIEMRWLYCFALHWIVDHLGFTGAVVAKWLAMTLAFALAASTIAGRRARITACVLLPIAILATCHRVFVRPELVSYVFVAAYVWLIILHQRTRSRWIYALPVCQMVWTNSHTLFAYGPALTGLWLIVLVGKRILQRQSATEQPVSQWRSVHVAGIVFAGCVIACLVNPYGLRGALFPFKLLAEIHASPFKSTIGEFLPIFSAGQPLLPVACFVALLVIAISSAVLNLRRLDLFLLIVCIVQAYLGWIAIRNVPLFCLAVIPFVADNVQRSALLSRMSPRHWTARVAAAALVLAIVGCTVMGWQFVTDRIRVRLNMPTQLGMTLAPHAYPIDAVRFLDEHHLPGPIFSTFVESTYLIATDHTVFIDPRLEVHDPELFERYMRILRGDEADWRDAVRDYGFRTAVIGLEYAELIRRVSTDQQWQLVYYDATAAVLMRHDDSDDAPTAPHRIDIAARAAEIRRDLPTPTPWHDVSFWSRAVLTRPYHQVGRFLMELGYPDLAESFVADAATANPFEKAYPFNLARILIARHDLEAAATQLRKVLDLAHDDWDAMCLLGQCELSTKRYDQAARWLEASVHQNPENATAWAALAKTYHESNNAKDAVTAAQRAVACKPANAQYRKTLARLHAELKQLDAAIVQYQQALKIDPNDSAVYGELAVLMAVQGRRSEAAALIQRGLAIDPSDETLLQLRTTLEQANRPAGN